MDVLLGLSLMTNDKIDIPYKKAMNLLSINPLFVEKLIKKIKHGERNYINISSKY